MSEPVKHKVVLLFNPALLHTEKPFFSSLHISKKGGIPVFEEKELNSDEIQKYFFLNQSVFRNSLEKFTVDGNNRITAEAEKKYSRKEAVKSFREATGSYRLRRLHEAFAEFKQFAEQVDTYHKIQLDNKRFSNQPCTFSTTRPQLQFSVSRSDVSFDLKPLFIVNGQPLPSEKIKRKRFLIELDSVYYQLSYTDYETLRWIEKTDLGQFGLNIAAFEENILAVLEKNNKVERNNLFDTVAIQVKPVNRVRLSEISKQFLVFNPEWEYDGFVLDPPFKKEDHRVVNGKAYTILRDQESEKDFDQFLKSLHPNFPRQLNGSYYLSFAEAQKKQWFLNTFHRLLELNTEVIGMDLLEHFRYSSFKIEANSKIVQTNGADVIIELDFRFGKEIIQPVEIQKILLAGQRAVLLKDGSMGILDEQYRDQFGLIMRHGKINGKQVTVPRWLAFGESENDEGKLVLKTVIKETWWEKWKQWNSTEINLFPQPSTIKAKLRNYQQKGFEWMALLAEAGAGGLLADDMGLGKTLQTISFIAHRALMTAEAKFLVICPASLMYNWQQEFSKFAPSLSLMIYYGNNRALLLDEKKDFQVMISSYNTVRNDIEKLMEIKFHVAVLDESHNIKNRTALTSKAVAKLNAEIRFALSGTPLMNNTFDLFAQYSFILPGLLGSPEFFKREYADPIDRYQEEEKVNALKKLTAAFSLRRTKEKVAADLPEKSEMVLWCNMYPSQKECYDQIKDNIRSNLFLQIKSEGLNKSKLAVLQGILKLRQTCNSPLLLSPDEQTTSDSVKIDVLCDELTSNLKDHKVLVFSQFTGMLDLIADRLRALGIGFFHFDGSTPPAKRMEMVDQFQDEKNKTNIFLISLKAGNSGLNLTAAGYVFLVDPWWNEAVQQQAIDRTHRIGQTKNVFAYKMICRDTIEEKILSLQERKKHLSEDLISTADGFVNNLSEEDVEWLFG
ncbi:DEAD/DEAH box helicase [Pollutibacter soli]|uniref:DEAD/DEAH box helicase n=1 Tax=Pollutibacter soli TaxID=3034157 RepID=UPI0030132093